MSPFYFVSEVNRSGYTIADSPSGAVLTDGVRPGQKYRAKLVYPLVEHPGMYLAFAAVRTHEDMVSFAKRYGLLGFSFPDGEPCREWESQARYLSDMIDLHRSGRMTVAQPIASTNAFLDQTRAVLVRVRGKLRIRFVPDNLLACIWLQFALSIDTKRTWRRCRYRRCRKWMEVSLDGRSSRAEYCDGACRHAEYRARKKG